MIFLIFAAVLILCIVTLSGILGVMRGRYGSNFFQPPDIESNSGRICISDD
jgi:hypothetical protein